MFQQLVPLLRQRSVLLTVTSLEDDQIRVNIMPKKLKEGENIALTTPMSFTGTAVELDEQLPDAIVSFVASHLELKHTLARAREEMDAAAKAAQEEARNKAKYNKKPSSESAGKVDPAAKEEHLDRDRAPTDSCSRALPPVPARRTVSSSSSVRASEVPRQKAPSSERDVRLPTRLRSIGLRKRTATGSGRHSNN
jgi:PRTRC genetic system protein E